MGRCAIDGARNTIRAVYFAEQQAEGDEHDGHLGDRSSQSITYTDLRNFLIFWVGCSLECAGNCSTEKLLTVQSPASRSTPSETLTPPRLPGIYFIWKCREGDHLSHPAQWLHGCRSTPRFGLSALRASDAVFS